MADTTVQGAKHRHFPACGLRKSAWLAGICLAAMAVLLLLTASVFTTYEIRELVAFRIYNSFSVTTVGIYIALFLAAHCALALPSLRPGFLLAAPAAILAGWAIVAGPSYGWLIKAGIVAAFAVSYVATLGTLLSVFAMALFGPLLGPVATGGLTGLLVHFVARTIAGQPLWDRPARREALFHCLGFIAGAYIVYLSIDGIDKDLARLRQGGAGLFAFIWLLWPIFLGAPTVHLACFAVARYGGGWPQGAIHPWRLLILCLACFALVGAGRSLQRDDPSLLLAWPAMDLQDAAFWRNHPRRDTPLAVGDYRVETEGAIRVQREWNRDLQRYDFFMLILSEALWPTGDAVARSLELRLRAAGEPYVPVVCDRPAVHGLMRCRVPDATEAGGSGGWSAPGYWIRYNYEVYAAAERPDLILGRKENFRSSMARRENPSATIDPEYDLSLAFTENRAPQVSVLMPIPRFELARWREGAAAFDRIVAHHLRPLEPR